MYKKGFTLIEIIISLVLIVLIGTISIISLSYENKDEEEITLEEEINFYYSLKENDSGYKYFYSDNDEKISCIKFSSIKSSGILDLDSMNIYNDNDIFKIVLNEDGVLESYEKIDDTSHCEYTVIVMEEEVNNSNLEITKNENISDEYSITQTTKQSSVDKNIFESTLNFDITLFKEIYKPVYVLIMLDKSGSMVSNDRSRNALSAISSMVEKIFEIDNSYIGFIDFGYYADNFSYVANGKSNIWVEKNYKSNLLTYINKISYISGVDNNYYDAYTKAINNYKIKEKSDYFTYVVLLSDAGNNNNGTTCVSSANKNNIVAGIREKVNKFIAVAYSPATTCLSSIASNNCPENGGSCYYLSNSSNVENIFDGITSKIQEETKIKNLKIEININDYFDLITLDGENMKYENNVITYEFDLENVSDAESMEYNKSLNYSLKFLSDKFEDVDSPNPEIKLFNQIKLTFTTEEGNYEQVINDTSIPTIKVSKITENAIN